MIHSMSTAEVATAERFERTGMAADAQNAARAREEFAEWLERFLDLDPIRASDLVLAINEALANCAEFAYVTADRPGTMDVQAVYDPADRRLTVTVADHGVWRMPDPQPVSRTRGRGIPLMQALSDRTQIDSSSEGTTVRMQWADVAARSSTA
jgi:serine/threonine-protein kinase RsbW